jgi:site-specific recombinase XerD
MLLETGSRLGPYEITSAIGTSGTSKVCRARETRLGREVVIKVLPRELAEQYLERYARKRKASWREDARRIKSNLNPVIGNIRAKDVTRAVVRRILETIAERGASIEANRTLAVIRKIYNWAVGEDLLEVNPAYRIPVPAD